MRKFNKETMQYEFVSRYKLLTKGLNEGGYTVTILSHNSENDMYKCRVQIGNSFITVWYTDEQVKEFYDKKREVEKLRKERHAEYTKKKKK